MRTTSQLINERLRIAGDMGEFMTGVVVISKQDLKRMLRDVALDAFNMGIESVNPKVELKAPRERRSRPAAEPIKHHSSCRCSNCESAL